MINKYRVFLKAQGSKSPSSQYQAAKLTLTYYRQRRSLVSTHSLHFYRYPILILRQFRHDWALQKLFSSYRIKIYSHNIQHTSLSDITSSVPLYPELLQYYKSKLAPFKHTRSQLSEFWHRIYHSEGTLSTRVIKTLENFTDWAKSGSWLDSFSGWVVKYVNLYHKALQEMVEGHREVTHNHDTVLEDGKTVKEKLDAFETQVKTHLNKEAILHNISNKHKT